MDSPVFRFSSRIQKEVVVDGGLTTVRVGRTLATSLELPAGLAPGLVRIRSASSEWVWSQTGPTVSILPVGEEELT
jgi:hypothetical protein